MRRKNCAVVVSKPGIGVAVPASMRNSILSVTAPLLFLAACGTGHAAMRGSVVMKVSETDAHVCLEPGQTQVGDHVQMFRNVCTSTGKRTTCEKVPVAEGVVTALLNDHYSTVRFPAGTSFAEGYTVEPIR